MNKVTKGALAAAAGAAILVGGAGTMAAWSDSSSLGSGTVTAGTLNIDQVPDSGKWHWGTPGGTEFNPATDRLVPGDTVVYVADYNITAVGTNLVATLTPTLGNLESGELAQHLHVTAVGDGGGEIRPTGSVQTKTIGTAITFTDVQGETGQGASASLAGGTVTLTQNSVTTP
ncbi:alternate-type signal peptide domain-containing protein [Gordonia alkaliphila]|uniref:Alternate-type signal peptide domain-containing protein n=1 Tax=Gordonia alkaliphila TaxID=1053547 RepID=A0ABP8Z2M3_9ACTN